MKLGFLLFRSSGIHPGSPDLEILTGQSSPPSSTKSVIPGRCASRWKTTRSAKHCTGGKLRSRFRATCCNRFLPKEYLQPSRAYEILLFRTGKNDRSFLVAPDPYRSRTGRGV